LKSGFLKPSAGHQPIHERSVVSEESSRPGINIAYTYNVQGHPSHEGNEAEIFIIAILWGKLPFLGKQMFSHFRGREFL